MLRVPYRLLALALAAATVARAQEAETAPEPDRPATETKAEAADRRIGFYFGVRLTKLSTLGQANGIGYVVTPPLQPGFPFEVIGKSVDADIHSRLNLEFFLGFRLRTSGNIEASFMQWDEKQDLLTIPPAGKAIANSLASPLAGFSEDVDGNGTADGFEGLLASEANDTRQQVDAVLDGAEDLNYNGQADFIRFATSSRIVGQAATDYQVFDVDYTHRLKELRRFQLGWRAGLRVATLSQTHDIGYREYGSFAVYTDEEGDRAGTAWAQDCNSYRNPRPVGSANQDGDGDGETNQAEIDGDGFMDGNCNTIVLDQLNSVETVSEDRIIGKLRTRGYGGKLGLDGKFLLSDKWRLVGTASVALLSGKTEYSYREAFTSERDRYPNFIDWDFNHDGVYDNFDLDFDGSCDRTQSADQCTPNADDGAFINGVLTGVNMRTGVGNSVVATPRGLNANAYRGANFGSIREGDPVGEPERNRDTVKETIQLHDLAGDSTGIQPVLDLNVGFEWQFSRFAHLGFGLRSTRWFDAGRFRNLANDVVAGRDPAVDGDFDMTGGYFTLTIVPR